MALTRGTRTEQMAEPTRREAVRTLSSAVAGMALQLHDCLAGTDGRVAGNPAGFTSLCFTSASGVRRRVYVTGTTGPAVILLHEVSGLTEQTFATARQLASAGYAVLVPLLFGAPGESAATRNIRRVCGDDQFACNRGARTSPEVVWLRELARHARERWPEGKGVGVIGMCLTGSFPLAMLRAPEIVAPVLCQPTLPFNRWNPLHALGWFTDQWALAVDAADLAFAQTSTSMPLLGIRYKGDRRCRKKRFERLTREFPGRFFRVDFPGAHHSTLVGDFCPEALAEVLAFFNSHLRTSADVRVPAFPILARHSLDEVTPPACGGPHADHRPKPDQRPRERRGRGSVDISG